MLTRILRILAVALPLCGTATSTAGEPYRHTLNLGSSDFQTRTTADQSLGNYFTVTFALPSEVTSRDVAGAFLEFYADVSAKPINDQTNPTPVVEVFLLTSAFAGSLDPESFDHATATARPIISGANRRIKIDITDIVNRMLTNPSGTHTMVVGALEGSREGVFASRTGVLPDGALARIVFYFEP